MRVLKSSMLYILSFTFRRNYLLLMLVAISIFPKLNAQESLSYPAVDSITYALYEEGNWHELIRQGNTAIEKGFDYHYMRMRVGIAYFMLHRYRTAATHFEKALGQNSLSQVAYNYLKLCYQWGGLETEAAALNRRYLTLAANQKASIPVLKGVSLFSGVSFSGSDDKISNLDLDGKENIYGEIIASGDAFIAHAGLNIAPASNLNWYAGYTLLRIEKHQRAMMQNWATNTTDTLDHRYTLNQSQFFLNAPLRLAKSWNLSPGLTLVRTKEQPYAISYDSLSGKYDSILRETSTGSYLVSLRAVKEMPTFNLGVAVGNSNLNNQTQWQGTLMTGWYPFANLNQYLLLRASALLDGGEMKTHYKAVAGSKVLNKLWIQGSVHTGNLKNAHDENGLLIYNTSGKIISRATASAFILLSPKLTLQLDYSFTKQQDNYIRYVDKDNYFEKTVQYNNHNLMGGLKWKL